MKKQPGSGRRPDPLATPPAAPAAFHINCPGLEEGCEGCAACLPARPKQNPSQRSLAWQRPRSASTTPASAMSAMLWTRLVHDSRGRQVNAGLCEGDVDMLLERPACGVPVRVREGSGAIRSAPGHLRIAVLKLQPCHGRRSAGLGAAAGFLNRERARTNRWFIRWAGAAAKAIPGALRHADGAAPACLGIDALVDRANFILLTLDSIAVRTVETAPIRIAAREGVMGMLSPASAVDRANCCSKTLELGRELGMARCSPVDRLERYNPFVDDDKRSPR